MQPGDDMVQHWRSVLDAKPGHPPALVGLTKAFAELNRGDDIVALVDGLDAGQAALADRMLWLATRAMPTNPALRVAYCRHAEARGDWVQAGSRWGMLRRQQPRRIETHLGYLHAMLQLGRFVEVQRGVAAAREVLGAAPELDDILARAIAAQHDAGGANRIAVEPVLAETPEQIGEIKKLLTGFESLGSTCEFGMLQRQFGAEPLGLMRFAGASFRTITLLLRTRFEGLGRIEQSEVTPAHGAYMLRHKPSGFSSHTGIKLDVEPDRAAVLRDQCRHTEFLRKKLIKDLEQAHKICVYRKPDLTSEEAVAIYEGLQEFGPNMLLGVRLHDDDHAIGSVDWINDRLLIATIDRQGTEFPGAGWDISVDYWIHFCRLAQARSVEMGIQAGAGAKVA